MSEHEARMKARRLGALFVKIGHHRARQHLAGAGVIAHQERTSKTSSSLTLESGRILRRKAQLTESVRMAQLLSPCV